MNLQCKLATSNSNQLVSQASLHFFSRKSQRINFDLRSLSMGSCSIRIWPIISASSSDSDPVLWRELSSPSLTEQTSWTLGERFALPRLRLLACRTDLPCLGAFLGDVSRVASRLEVAATVSTESDALLCPVGDVAWTDMSFAGPRPSV